MKHAPCEHLCPRFQAAMAVLAKPWNGLVMATLGAEGALRFGELKVKLHMMGDRMLSARLKELESRGLVERRALPGPPARIEYALTEVGRGFREVVEALGAWGSRFAPASPRGRGSSVARRKPRAAARRSTSP